MTLGIYIHVQYVCINNKATIEFFKKKYTFIKHNREQNTGAYMHTRTSRF